MVYADNTCPAVGPDSQPQTAGGFESVAASNVDWTDNRRVRQVYFDHWRYNRADPRYQTFLATTPMYQTWDDHEIINDAGVSWDFWNVTSRDRPGYPTLASAASQAFFAWAPLARDPADANRIYRRYRWAADVDLFVLDTRSYRSRNELADTPENQKTMLGAAQLSWLRRELTESKATWKVVASSVPLSVPTGGPAAAIYGSDSWANGTSWDYSSRTGFERELLDLLGSFDAAGVRNLVVLSGDIHQGVVVRSAVDLNADGRPLIFHEVTAGPIASSPGREAPGLDPTLNPTLLYREGGFFNFGYVRVERQTDGLAHFVAEIRDAAGQTRPGSRLDLTPS
jgi:alkaline phosphatase D